MCKSSMMYMLLHVVKRCHSFSVVIRQQNRCAPLSKEVDYPHAQTCSTKGKRIQTRWKANAPYHMLRGTTCLVAVLVRIRSSATADGPRDALC